MMTKETVKIDGGKLRELRVSKWLDRGEVADRAGLNIETITGLETNKWSGGSRLSTVRKLAAVLEVDPRELLEKSNEPIT